MPQINVKNWRIVIDHNITNSPTTGLWVSDLSDATRGFGGPLTTSAGLLTVAAAKFVYIETGGLSGPVLTQCGGTSPNSGIPCGQSRIRRTNPTTQVSRGVPWILPAISLLSMVPAGALESRRTRPAQMAPRAVSSPWSLVRTMTPAPRDQVRHHCITSWPIRCHTFSPLPPVPRGDLNAMRVIITLTMYTPRGCVLHRF